MKKLNALVLLTILASSFVVIGCSGGDSSTETTNTPPTDSQSKMTKTQSNQVVKPDAN